nr:hypothetical protein [Chitinophagaceae bacterium]
MTNNEYNPLDEYLQEKVENAPMLFREEHWDKMSGLLDEEDKNKKKPFLWRGLSILAVLLTLGLGAYVFPKLKKAPQQESVTPKTEQADQQTLPSVNQDRPESQENFSESSNTSTSNLSSTNQQAVSKNSDESTKTTSSSSSAVQSNVNNESNKPDAKNERSLNNQVSSISATSKPANQQGSKSAQIANINATSTTQTASTNLKSNAASQQVVSNSKASAKDNMVALPSKKNSLITKNQKNKQDVAPTSSQTDNTESNSLNTTAKNLTPSKQANEGQALASQTAKVVNVH